MVEGHRVGRYPAAKIKGEGKLFVGTWHIYEMEQWDEEYFTTTSKYFLVTSTLTTPTFFGVR
jgi:hypothetical protein